MFKPPKSVFQDIYGFEIAQNYLDAVSSLSKQNVGGPSTFANFSQGSFSSMRGKAHIYFAYKRSSDFYRMISLALPEACCLPKSKDGSPNSDRHLVDMVTAEPSNLLDGKQDDPLPLKNIQASDADYIAAFLSKPENRRLAWRLHRGRYSSADEDAFGFWLSEGQASSVGEVVALLLDVTVSASRLLRDCVFSFRAIRFRAHIESEHLSIYEYGAALNNWTQIGSGVKVRIFGGGGKRWIELVAEAGALDGKYNLDEPLLKLLPVTVKFSFHAEMYTRSDHLVVLDNAETTPVDRAKEAIISAIIKMGLGADKGEEMIVLATQQFIIAPGPNRA